MRGGRGCSGGGGGGGQRRVMTLDDVMAALRVGVHSDVQVTASRWGRQLQRDPAHTVTQVFGSACALGGYSHNRQGLWDAFAQLVLRASYEATLWVGLEAARRHGGMGGSRRVFLTLLGSGVFGNDMEWVVDAIRAACERFRHYDLDVRIVSYTSPAQQAVVRCVRQFRGAQQGHGCTVRGHGHGCECRVRGVGRRVRGCRHSGKETATKRSRKTSTDTVCLHSLSPPVFALPPDSNFLQSPVFPSADCVVLCLCRLQSSAKSSAI